jgi:hypothetical protein
MLDDAEIQSRRLVADAEADARRRGETERRRLEEEVLDLAGRRDALLADVEALTRFEADYRDRMVRALEADLSALRSRPPASPGPRPETSDVDLPVLAEGFARREQTEPPAASPAPQARPAEPPVAPVEPVAPVAPQPAPFAASPSQFAAQIPPAFQAAPPAPPAPPTEAERASALDTATEAVDVQSLFDRAGMGSSTLAFEKPASSAPSAPAPDPFAPKPAAPSAPAATAAPTEKPSMSNTGPTDAIDAEVLDDDAFFATLREAVHDDTPLGPREEGDATGENMFFDQEAENSGFRDVFRRRR